MYSSFGMKKAKIKAIVAYQHQASAFSFVSLIVEKRTLMNIIFSKHTHLKNICCILVEGDTV